ncbi:haloacid dehalogenase type II [Paraglaciecola sp. L1A13]|uniref:haloacid dehalogenase type II n=1 Tax=Paraglaciecola sp. L1A13 TaxID=2686359 RepID=UPI00131C1A16|nr:haloacid dehalogenase type II [Paraglaciecola sp. L1A13]
MAFAAPKPKVIIFDVNETLLDLDTMSTSVGKALNGHEELTTLWFSTMLHHSLVTTVTGDYQDFGKIGVAALMMVAQNNNIQITEEEALTAIKTPLLSLPAHADVKPGLTALKAQGYKLVSLTNSSNKGVETQFKNAGLTDYFDKRMSIEDIKVYKPDLRSYAWALEQLNVKPEEALMVAAHGWDIAGAKAAGLQTAFVARPGKALYPLAPKPDYVVKDLSELVEILK